MTVPIYANRNVTGDLYVYALSSVYGAGWRIYDIDLAQAMEPDPYEKVRRDPVIAQSIDQRLHGVAGRQWRIMPHSDAKEDKQAAKIVEEAFRNITGFTEARYELAQAVIRGRSYSWIWGERKHIRLGDQKEMSWWVPVELQDIDRRRFRYIVERMQEPDGSPKSRVDLELFSVDRRVWEKITHPEWLVESRYNDEEARLGYGRGLLEAIYFYYWMKSIVLREGVEGVERWAQGTTIAKIDGLRAGDPTRSNDAVKTAVLDVLKKMRARSVQVFDKNDDVQVIERTGTGHTMVMQFLQYFDDALRGLILGATLPFGGGGREGSMARSQVESDVHESLVQFDRDKLDDDITRCLVKLFWDVNRTAFAKIGLADARMPTFETVQERREDPAVNAGVISTVLASGVKLRRDEVYRKIGFTPPQEDDDVIEGFGGQGMFTETGPGSPGSPDSKIDKPGDPRFNLAHPKTEEGKFAPKAQGLVKIGAPEVTKGSDLSKE
jgi:phage gp29-like protein